MKRSYEDADWEPEIHHKCCVGNANILCKFGTKGYKAFWENVKQENSWHTCLQDAGAPSAMRVDYSAPFPFLLPSSYLVFIFLVPLSLYSSSFLSPSSPSPSSLLAYTNEKKSVLLSKKSHLFSLSPLFNFITILLLSLPFPSFFPPYFLLDRITDNPSGFLFPCKSIGKTCTDTTKAFLNTNSMIFLLILANPGGTAQSYLKCLSSAC